MNRPLPAALLLALTAQAGDFEINGRKLTLPDGFAVELAAAAPLVERPIVADFDELGRLYVADSSGSNDKVEKQLAEKPHRIVRLEDTDHDGRFDKSVVFADKMMFPEGTLWFAGSLYVAAPPTIWKLTDTDGDGVADRREEWFNGGTLTGCANDLHGPYLGPDGRIYWCKGAFAQQRHEIAGKPFVTRASHLFRARPDGSALESVMTGGMDNPVEVAFTADGEPILTCTFFQQPAAGHRDGLIHAIYGGLFGKQHDVLEGHTRTGDLMPVLAHLGPAAPAGLTRYRSRVFGADYENNLFAALFNLHRVTRHILQPEGATFKTRDEDFLVAESTDFHPTDVLEDADGSLLVIDTGGWYKLCCPTSQLYKPDVLGAIYRVRRKEAPRVESPRGLDLPWDAPTGELALRLSDQRPAVRERAIQVLAQRGADAIPALAEVLKKASSEEARRNAVWALTRIDGENARAAARVALSDQEQSVRHAAAHSAALWRDAGASPQLVNLISADDPQLRRAAAEALGRIGDNSAVPALLGALAPGDRALEHSIIFALVELGDPSATGAALHAGTPAAAKAALTALEQMPGRQLQSEQVLPLVGSSNAELRKTALWIISRHPDWGDVLLPFLATQFGDDSHDRASRVQLLSGLAMHPAVQQLLAANAREVAAPKAARVLALQAMAAARLKETPRIWKDAMTEGLAATDADIVNAATEAVRNQPDKVRDELRPAVLDAARATALPSDVRITLLASIRGGLPSVDPEIFQLLRTQLQPGVPVTQRASAAAVLGSAKLTTAQQRELLEELKNAGPFEINKLLGAFENSSDQALGLELVGALKEAPGLASLGAGALGARFAKYPSAVHQEVDALLATLGTDAAKQRSRLDELSAALKDGDVRRGQAVFNSTKAGCVTCHTIGYVGGKLGPDLTRIGQVRNERDLLEAVVYPSASFVRSYEPTLVTTKSGEIYNALLREEGADVVLAIAPGTEIRVARSDIAEMQPGTISLMPQGLDQILTSQELGDLITFLKATK